MVPLVAIKELDCTSPQSGSKFVPYIDNAFVRNMCNAFVHQYRSVPVYPLEVADEPESSEGTPGGFWLDPIDWFKRVDSRFHYLIKIHLFDQVSLKLGIRTTYLGVDLVSLHKLSGPLYFISV